MIHPSLSVRRRALLGAAAAAPVAVALAGCRSAPAPEPGPGPGGPDEVRYNTAFPWTGRESFTALAEQRGLFTQAGLDVHIEQGFGTRPNVEALVGGLADFAMFDLSGGMVEYGGELGTEFRAIAAVNQRPLACLMAFEEAGIRSPGDLEGRRVGLPPFGATGLLWDGYAQLAGIDVSKVEIVPLGAEDLTPALTSGRVDAIGEFIGGQPLISAAAGGREVVVLPYSDYLDDLFGLALFTTAELAETNPALCVRFRDVLLGALAAAMDNPEIAGRALVAGPVPEADPEVAAEEMALMAPYCQPREPGQPLGHMAEADVMRAIAFMAGGGLAGPGLESPEQIVAFDLVPA